ncbi:MAG: molybdopterin molybdotransferase MoeA [Acidimicrobiaceae bacterium]|nr:molybdopterin molybdotransferase MoeA [Acidimicrobiaceae bacterium]
MIPLSEAQSYVLKQIEPLPRTVVPLKNALGLVLTESVVSTETIPPFTNTAVDGYALRSIDTVNTPVTLNVVETISAGDDKNINVGPNEAVRIMTGAVMPAGADAVIMVENTRLLKPADSLESALTEFNSTTISTSTSNQLDLERVVISRTVQPGDHIRHAGDDISAGQIVLQAGTPLQPGHLGVLASIGCYQVATYRRPRVGVMSTGDELVDEPIRLQRGQIRDSNRNSLLGLVDQAGFIGVDLGIARDNEDDIKSVLQYAINECDAVLSSGGVSMGDYDYVKTVLEQLGEMRWMQIAIKPAKPFAFGLVQGIPVFGLPGNPVSSMVSFELLAKPALRAMAGYDADALGPFTIRAVSQNTLSHPRDGKTHYIRVFTKHSEQGTLQVARIDGQGSHQLATMAQANGLAVVQDNLVINPGDVVDVIPLNVFMNGFT